MSIETVYSSSHTVIDATQYVTDHWQYVRAYLGGVKRRHETISYDDLLSEFSLVLVASCQSKPSEHYATATMFRRMVRKTIWRIRKSWVQEYKWKMILAGVSLKRYRELLRAGKWSEIRKISTGGRVTGELMRIAVASSISHASYMKDLTEELAKFLPTSVVTSVQSGETMRQIAANEQVSVSTVHAWFAVARRELKNKEYSLIGY